AGFSPPEDDGGLKPAAPPEETPKSDTDEERWGSGEIVIRHVAITDHEGRELVALGAGTPVVFDFDVEARVPQDDFVFGLGIYHADGTCVYGTNTDVEGYSAERIEGQVRVRFVIASLDLVAGTYRIDVAVHTRNGRAFDYRRNALRIVVGSRVHDIGVYRPKHEWRFDGGIEFRTVDTLRQNVPAQIAEALGSFEGEKPKRRKR
ncbi:MAG TPA: Wzt carbohydrate-binding domain-containing protein, partial [Thermoanaerobaculia bacterium]|nr:Wzt carbohydrate-binding domain-containing protein [Thermoanaerobaculia bacterium]